MPKMKTKRAAAKRFTVTASGKVKRKQAYRSHFMRHRSKTQKRNLRAQAYLSDPDAKNIKKILPY